MRAAIVLAVVIVLVWVIARPLFFKLLVLLLRLAGLLIKLICLLGGKLLGLTAKKSPERYAVQYNRLAERTGRCNERLLKWSEKLGGKQQFHLGRMLLLYGALMVLIVLPNFLEPILSKEYLPYFSVVSNLYQKIEAPALKAAAAYSPLFSNDQDTTVEEPDPEEEMISEIWLSLSDRGRNGSNLRAGPGKDHPVLDTVVGSEQLLYLDEQSGGWVHVQTEDGIEGWIYNSLVTGIPEETSG